MNTTDFLWVEKYRPQKISDCILPAGIKATFKQIVDSGQMINLILSGGAGQGKTTVARALCKEMGMDWMMINGSEESGIDTLRNKIRQFASTVSLEGSGKPKVVILDEADYLNASSTQVALRGFIEEFSGNCRFILTCNFKNRIIEPLHSRCSVIDFTMTKKELAKQAEQFHTRLKGILTSEKVKFDEAIIAELIIRHAPDWRRVLNECQRHSITGEITASILVGLSNQSITALVSHLAQKDFKGMRSWVAQNSDIDSSVIFRTLYDLMADRAEPASLPQIVITLADYQYKAAFVADKELNTVAALTELMANTTWKTS